MQYAKLPINVQMAHLSESTVVLHRAVMYTSHCKVLASTLLKRHSQRAPLSNCNCHAASNALAMPTWPCSQETAINRFIQNATHETDVMQILNSLQQQAATLRQ